MPDAKKDYCLLNCKSITHIACRNKGWGCSDGSFLNLTVDHQKHLLNFHNSIRNMLAKGKLYNLTQATKMR